MRMQKGKPMQELVFVTHNKGKIASARKYLEGIDLQVLEREVDEPRSDDVRYISECKARQAYALVGKPCISLDAGFWIEALNGFPRAFVNFALETVGISGILKLMEGVSDRRCHFQESLAYYDGREVRLFAGRHPGRLAEAISGRETEKKWSDLWYVFIPDGFDKTLAAMSDAERELPRPGRVEAMEQFAAWYREARP